MMTFANIDLIRLMPAFLRADPYVEALCSVLNPYFHELDTETKLYLVLNQIDRLVEYDLDALAAEMELTWYSTADSIETKRSVIKTAAEILRIKGTVGAVEGAVQSVFGDGKVLEWFEYSGQPGHFKVITNNYKATDTMSERFLQIVDKVKRKSAHLDQIIVELASQMQANFGLVLHLGETITVRQVN